MKLKNEKLRKALITKRNNENNVLMRLKDIEFYGKERAKVLMMIYKMT